MTASGVDRYQDLFSQRAARGPRPGGGGGSHTFLYNFGVGNPDPGSFPYQQLTQAMADVMEVEGAAALSYGHLMGYQAFREWVCHKYKVFENLDLTPDNILIANGSNDALGLVIQTFVDDGDAVITEAPTYSATLQTLRRCGADLYGIEVDAEGMRIDLVRERLEALAKEGRRCKLILTIPTFQNPAGPSLSDARRQELLELARTYGTIILEDDAYGELRYEGAHQKSLYELDQDGLVVRTGTLSKVLGAGARVGWVIAPTELIPYISAFGFGGGAAPLMSRVCLYYMRGNLVPHVEELRQIYKDKRDAMLDELQRGLGETDAVWSKPEGGFFIWLKLPTGTDQRRVLSLAAEAGVGVNGGQGFMPNGGADDYIRLAFSYEALDKIREGTRLLCKAIHEARTAG